MMAKSLGKIYKNVREDTTFILQKKCIYMHTEYDYIFIYSSFYVETYMSTLSDGLTKMSTT